MRFITKIVVAKARVFLCFMVLLGGQWAAGSELRLVTTNWAPYYASDLPQDGVVSEIVMTAFARAGKTASLEFMPWERAMRSSLKGGHDVVMGAYYSDLRSEKFEYSDPIMNVKLALIAKKSLGVTSYQDFNDLKEYRFGVVTGWVNSVDFDNAHFLKKEAVPSPLLNLRKLHYGRIDLTVMSVKVLEHTKQQSEVLAGMDTVVLKPLLAENPLYLIVPKHHPEAAKIIQDFNRGLRMMKSDGTYAKILQKHGFGQNKE